MICYRPLADPAARLSLIWAYDIRTLKQIAAVRGCSVIPGHDPVAWPALTTELGGVPADASAAVPSLLNVTQQR